MQQVSCLCFLIYQLPWILSTTPSYFIVFPTGSSVSLQWFTSYLSSQTPTVGIPPYSSPSFPLTGGVPQSSVLGPVLFNLYTTPFSSLISASPIYHLLYADDTQLVISFVPKNVSSAINNLQSTILWAASQQLTGDNLSLPMTSASR